MFPRDFIRKWRRSQLKESAGYVEHFLDLCRLLGHPTPAESDADGQDFCFQRHVAKREGDKGFVDAWKKGYFAWEYKGKHKDLDAAWAQLDAYRADLDNPPLLVTCDFERIEVHTSFTNSPHKVQVVELDDLLDADKFDLLHSVFFEPERLRPGRISKVVTRAAAQRLAELAQKLRGRGLEARPVARFLDRIVFCLFAEDIRMLPAEITTRLIDQARANPERFAPMTAELFSRMASGGLFGVDQIPHVNGRLFDDAETIELRVEEIETLWQAARLDWSAIDPSIFGTLFVRGMDPARRAQLGAQYTSREDIEALIEPVVMAPLRRDWEETKALCERMLLSGRKDPAAPAPSKPLGGPLVTKVRKEVEGLVLSFLDRLARERILDPACGSGNFLYVALQKVKDLELEAESWLVDHGFNRRLRLGFGPWQLWGIEIDVYAHELAQMTVWIGYLQWLWRHGNTQWKEPILQAMSNIACKDAILDLSDPESPKEPEWPEVDYIVGNPPFLGGKMLRRELGDAYVDRLFGLYESRVAAEADLVCYWFEKARERIQAGKAKRAGLLATQGIRGGANRKTLERIKASGDIFWAESDREWVLDGAAVHVSAIGFDGGTETHRVLDGHPVALIHSNLSAAATATKAKRLAENLDIAFMGDTKGGAFDIQEADARALLDLPNPNGFPNSDVLRPWVNGLDVTRRSRGMWIIDFADERNEARACRFEAPWTLLAQTVQPERARNSRESYRRLWWLHVEPRPRMRAKLARLGRHLATTTVSKHRLFAWILDPTLPDHQLIAFARDDDYFFGVLHSRPHEIWALAQGTQLREKESGFRYTPTTCFETFPFPNPAGNVEATIAAAARELDSLRQRWLNPPEWTREEILEFPGSLDGPWKRFVHAPDARGIGTVRWPRVTARDEESAKKLAKRTLTNLYNERPAWLANAHRALDEAVFAAYGWPTDLLDEQILEKLLALNLKRAGNETTVHGRP